MDAFLRTLQSFQVDFTWPAVRMLKRWRTFPLGYGAPSVCTPPAEGQHPARGRKGASNLKYDCAPSVIPGG